MYGRWQWWFYERRNKGKDDFVKDIKEQFGSDVRFNNCSGDNMDVNEAFDFLIRRKKISIDTSKSVTLKMCDEKGKHTH